MIKIEKVKLGDEKDLAYIQTESWKSAFKGILKDEDLEKYTEVKRAEEMYKSLLENNVGNGYILSIDEKPHCIAYFDKARDEEFSGYGELICIHSLASNWGKGYGSYMMEFILDKMKDLGYKKVLLWVFEENNRARRFYEKHGFILGENRKSFRGATEVIYFKVLSE